MCRAACVSDCVRACLLRIVSATDKTLLFVNIFIVIVLNRGIDIPLHCQCGHARSGQDSGQK